MNENVLKTLSYSQLRQILCLILENESIRVKLEYLLSGKELKLSEIDFLQFLAESQVDKDMLRILSGTDPETLEAMEAVGYLIGFFGYIHSSKEKLRTCLSSFGLKLPKVVMNTSGNGLK